MIDPNRAHVHFLCAVFAQVLLGCTAEQPSSRRGHNGISTGSARSGAGTTRGVDFVRKIIRIGVLNDESGPAATIGKHYAIGKRMLAAQVNAGGSDILPEGWTIELIERDHGCNPGRSEQVYQEIKDRIYFVGTSFGTLATLPLRPFLAADRMVAFPASLLSEMAEFENTPPLGPSYSVEIRRAIDWAVDDAGGISRLKAAVVADPSDYGKEGVRGLREAAAFHGFPLTTEQIIEPDQRDFTAIITALKQAGTTHVVLTVLPSSTGPLLDTAAKLKFTPMWIGNTPSWIDLFFAHPELPPQVFTNFHWATGLPFWGEDIPGMNEFIEAYETYGKDQGRPDFYILASYVQGLVQLEIAKRALRRNDGSPEGYLKVLHELESFTAGGLVEPLNLSKVPYMTSTRTRVLKPDFERKSWTVVASYARPKNL